MIVPFAFVVFILFAMFLFVPTHFSVRPFAFAFVFFLQFCIFPILSFSNKGLHCGCASKYARTYIFMIM